jgi:hypothetical protein
MRKVRLTVFPVVGSTALFRIKVSHVVRAFFGSRLSAMLEHTYGNICGYYIYTYFHQRMDVL